jgi:hypothetical protein
MTGHQYKRAIEILGMNQLKAGRWLGVSPRTAQNYAKDGPPAPIAKLLRAWIRLELDPKELR